MMIKKANEGFYILEMERKKKIKRGPPVLITETLPMRSSFHITETIVMAQRFPKRYTGVAVRLNCPLVPARGTNRD
jgi:hypothetical protein